MKKELWWKTSVIYQIYPRSYQDSNGDGVGDLKGIIERMDYVQWLGVEAVWLSPIYPSPMADFGYDISDYQDIDPLFGSLADFDELLEAVHSRGMKLILDFVPNHTSDQHPWFLESRSSRDNPKRDWYIWQDAAADGGVPNNWLGVFGGSAWEWDEVTGQYYYHGFLKEQPDLNWRNPEVREAMLNTLRFWLDRGVDGFRVDVIWYMIKDAQLRDNPVNPDYNEYMPTYDRLLPVYSTDQPEVHEVIREMRELMDSYEERMMVGEVYLPVHRLMTYYGVDNKGAHLPFNFQLISLPWDAMVIAAAIDEYEGALPADGWPNWVLGNHDRPRIVSRIGTDQARVAAMLLLTLRGTPTMYYGDEIGMRDIPIPFDEVQDPQGLNMPEKNLSRDPCRTPMQWDDSNNAGFSSGKPWLRIDSRYVRNNVELQRNDPDSLLSLYRKLIALRQREPSLVLGVYTPVFADQQMIVYLRSYDGSASFLVALNLSHRPAYFRPVERQYSGVVVVSTNTELEGTRVSGSLSLAGDEAVVVRLD
ncbi:alpha-amylase family glycosyl hydrolase [Pedobacter faecalis]|uniref:alpha-amylase family glycosyl hydrolase n=1 Tax=Pedobacter faecalis TaxID=3041495 RepID=UPI00254D7AB3|nr:alpha-amylase family glycosyl hydrolase [Pedobacter sp. ELA7]